MGLNIPVQLAYHNLFSQKSMKLVKGIEFFHIIDQAFQILWR